MVEILIFGDQTITIKKVIEMEAGMDYITIKEASDRWGLSVRRIQTLCSEEQIAGAIRFSGVWAIPNIAEKPVDHRVKTGKYIKSKGD